MAEAVLNSVAKQLVEMTLNKTKYDEWDLQWYTESPFWRRSNMYFSREYKTIPDYELGNIKHGMTLDNIKVTSENLIDFLKIYKNEVNIDEMQRANYLLDHLQHLNLRTRYLMGEKFSFDEMTDGLYCLVAPEYDYRKFDSIIEELKQALPGKGTIQERIEEFKHKIMVPRENLLGVLTNTTQYFHDVTMKKMHVTGNSMPRVRVRELTDKDSVFLSILFGYDYNHLEYERNFNLLYPWTVDKVMEYIGHEMEPGHLTYFEKRLQSMINTCWPEMSIVSLFSSSNAFSEGSSRHAYNMCFDNSMSKQVEFEKEYIFEPAGLDLDLVELMELWHKYCEIAGYGKMETSRNIWDGKWTIEEGSQFLEKYGFCSKGDGEKEAASYKDDIGHYVAHDYSRDTIREYFNSYSHDIDKQWELYEKLCSSHMSMREIKDKTFRPYEMVY